MTEPKKLNLTDSHAHLDMPEFDSDREEVIFRAETSGVKQILCPVDLCSEKSLENGLRLKEDHQNIYLAAGVHPHQAKELNQKHLELTRKLTAENKIIAIGEIGLDFHYNFSPPEKQIEAFRTQLELAKELRLPVIIHSRLAAEQIIESIKATKFNYCGILHCFTENFTLARTMIDYGFLVSFSGILTYQRADDLRETARKLPLNSLLVETDSPYLIPLPEKKTWKRNEPAFVLSTARELARLKNIPLEDLAEITSANFFRLFGLKK